jgi:hypothetical protein
MKKAWILVALAGSVATAVACSSSSSTAPAQTGDDASADDASATDSGSSSGATPDAGLMIGCKSATDCTAGQICCGSYVPPTSFKTACQVADCTPINVPVLGMIPAQGCTTDTECRDKTATCEPNQLLSAVSPGAKVCTPPASDSGTDSGPALDAAPGVDAATDAAADAH